MKEPATRKTDPSVVQAVERALTLLELIASDTDAQTLQILTKKIGLPASTVHRLLTTMANRQFVLNDREKSSWRIGQKAFSVGMAFVRQENLLLKALPLMKALRDKTGETVNLAIRNGDAVVTIGQVESRHVVRAVSEIGGVTPAVNCALGKAMLATFSEADVQSLLKAHGLRRFTRTSLTHMELVLAELAKVRRNRFATDDGEYIEEVRCAAAPIFNSNAEAIASVSISALKSRVAAERLGSLGRDVARMAIELTSQSGWSIPNVWVLPKNTRKTPQHEHEG